MTRPVIHYKESTRSSQASSSMFDRSKEFQELSKSSSPQSNTIWPFSPSSKDEELEDLEVGKFESSFPEKVTLILAALDTVSSLTKEIEGLHKNALLLADAKDLAQISAKIEIKVTAAALNTESARKNLKSIEVDLRNKTSSFSPIELQALQSKHRTMCSQFLRVVGAFEAMQELYKRKYKQQLQRQYLLVNPQVSQQELEQLGQSSQTSLLLSEQVFKMNTLTAKKALRDMKERFEEILMIEKSIGEIQKMFSDISLMVQQQGEMINSIDDFLNQTSLDLEAGNEALKKKIELERRKQIQRRTLYGIGLALLSILILIIVNELR